MFKKLEAWLLAHPGVIHVMEGLLYAVLLADYAYLKPLLAGGTMPTSSILITGILNAAFVAAKLYVSTTISQNQGQIIAGAQDLLDQLATTTASPTNPAPLKSVGIPSSAALTPLKMILFLIGFSLVVSNAFAWDNLPAKEFSFAPKEFSFAPKASLNIAAINPTVAGDDELDAVPTASLGFGVGNGDAPSYGYTGAWDLILNHVSQGSVPGTVSVVPYFGVGGAVYVDLGPWITSGLQTPVLADGGFNIIGPQINGLVPSFQIVWNFQSGEQRKIVALTAPFEVLSGAGIFKVFGL